MTAFRSTLFVIWMYGLMAVMAVLFAPALLGPRSWARWCVSAWLTPVFWGLRVMCGVSWELRGREHLPSGPALIASKHQSMFDTLAPWTFLDDPAIILKQSLSRLPFFGWFAVKLANIVVDRAAGATALRKMVRDAQARAADGRQILIFPEGTRVPPGERVRYKPGVFQLYRALDAPCVPIALNSGHFWPAHGVLRHPGRIIVQALEPIPPGLDRETFLAELERRIETAVAALPPYQNAAPSPSASSPEKAPHGSTTPS